MKRALCLYEKNPIPPALYHVNLYSIEMMFLKKALNVYEQSPMSILKEPYVYMKRAPYLYEKKPIPPALYHVNLYSLEVIFSIWTEPYIYIKRALYLYKRAPYLYEKRPIPPALYHVNLYSLEVIFSKHKHTQGRHVRQRLDVTQLCMYVCDVTHSNAWQVTCIWARAASWGCVCVCVLCVCVCVCECVRRDMHKQLDVTQLRVNDIQTYDFFLRAHAHTQRRDVCRGVASLCRLLKIIWRFCRISSLL